MGQPPPLQGIDAVVIGASAGGVEALGQLLGALPAHCAAAVVIVLHLPREPKSLLVDVFRHRCALPVLEAQDKTPLVAGSVHVAPPDYHLLVDRGADRSPALALSVDEPVHYSRPSIDVLFESAAAVYGARLAAIVLTGGNQDGAEGLATVQRRGGVVAVQDPADAQVPLMPQSALGRCPGALVLSLPQLAAWLRTLGARERSPA